MYRVRLTKKQRFLLVSVVREVYDYRKASYQLLCLCGDGYEKIKSNRKRYLKDLLKLLDSIGGAVCEKKTIGKLPKGA